LGASFIGADWQKGMITTTLTWEPRRVRLLAVKFVVVALTGFVFCVLTQLALAGALWPVATFRGSTAGLDATWLRATTGFALRIAFVCGLTAVVGCAIATVGRNTTAALGVAFVYFAVLEGLIRGFRPSWQPWLLGDNAAQFIANEPAGLAMADKTTADVTIVLLAYVTVAIAIATVFFSRRDVT
jgi:ABC-type transport system involved in multi-copper enzyme maturation permease subunit